MIYLLFGSDTEKSRTKLHELVESLLKKKPDASHLKVTDETFSESQIEELMSGMGLFSQKSIIEVDNVFRNKEAKTALLERLKDIAASENIFVFLESELLKAEKVKFEKHAEKVQEFSRTDKDVKDKKSFNIFSLTDALGKRDKKNLWVLYTTAKMKDVAAEEIHGILIWQVKAMLLAQKTKSPQESGLNPFVYQKSQGFLRNYSPEEVTTMSSKLVEMYHQARRGIVEFDVALEKFILEL